MVDLFIWFVILFLSSMDLFFADAGNVISFFLFFSPM